MQDNLIFVFVVLLVFSTSFNRGQKIKAADRRFAGVFAQPRIGRNSELLSLPRSDRAQGMLHYPRVGRSDVSSFGNLNQFQDLPPETDVEFSGVRDVEPDALLDLDYEEYANKLMAMKRADKAPKNGIWLMANHVHGYKEPRSAPKIDDLRLYYSVLRDSRNTQGQGGYTPRLGRENERDATSFL
ncbi:PREDICTED: CAPA peptides-like isoform X2 [Dinoponera quadriceps]|uniref:CAPA peptides-like isoform X2 n=1 Tax=Dinoponera quadriceps TaxID=609295 RepID=A0A6P3YCJ6_DINQU|nr:PREDICTED: CAPA peptides-like isoform X2 [Dinoponera quadriceps]